MRAPTILYRAGVAALANRNNIGRYPMHCCGSDRADPDCVTMFPSRPRHSRHSVSAVLAHPIQNLGAVKSPALTVQIAMSTPTEAETQRAEQKSHNTPVSSTSSGA
jgi:hypothetical protein